MAHHFHGNAEKGCIVVSGVCKVLKTPYSFEMSVEEFERYRDQVLTGIKLIQEALPDVSPENREFLITEYSPEGWDTLFGATDS